jgi:diacylglycerol kinase (ATP)
MRDGLETHGLKRLYLASLNTVRGMKFAARSEAALREELFILILAVPGALFLAPSIGWYVAMIGVILAVLAIELLNTAVEKLADHVTPDFHQNIGVVKDIGSAAVGCGLALGLLIWGGAAMVRFDLLDKMRALFGA